MKRSLYFSVMYSVLFLFVGCEALQNAPSTGAGSSVDNDSSRFGANSDGEILGVQGVSWTEPSFGNPTVSGMVRTVVIQETSDQSLWWQHCFNNNTNCANNSPNTVRSLVGNDPTAIHGIQLNINRNTAQYSDVKMIMSVRTAELQFSTRTGESRFFNPSVQHFNHNWPAATCQPGAGNSVAFWPTGSEAALITGLYLLEEYTNEQLDSQGRSYYTGAHLTGGKIWSRGIKPKSAPFEADFVPKSAFDIITFGAKADSFQSAQGSDANTLVTNALGAVGSGQKRVVTGICIQGTKTYVGGGTRPLMLGLRARSYIPAIEQQ